MATPPRPKPEPDDDKKKEEDEDDEEWGDEEPLKPVPAPTWPRE